MSRREKIYEGKAKILYKSSQPNALIQYFKDDATAFNAEKHEVIDGKGVLNNRISEYIFLRLAELGIPTHFIKSLNMREQLIHQVDIIPIEVVVRNVAAGSICSRIGLEEGMPLPRSIVEFFYKSDELNDPMVSEDHITAFGWATPPELEDMVGLSLRINDFLTGLFYAVGIRLVDFKLEFGRTIEGNIMQILLADEISPDNCRLWDLETNKKLDKDVFRRDLGNIIDTYKEVAKRLGLMNDTEPKQFVKPTLVTE